MAIRVGTAIRGAPPPRAGAPQGLTPIRVTPPRPVRTRRSPRGARRRGPRGKTKVAAARRGTGAAESACDWTVEKPPVYRLMELNMRAYTRNGRASGDGSAPFAATDAYELALGDMQAPPKGSPAPQATVRILSGFGNEAFSALRVYRVGGAGTGAAAGLVRCHNGGLTVTA